MKSISILAAGLLALTLAGCSAQDASKSSTSTSNSESPPQDVASATKPSSDGLLLAADEKGIVPASIEIPAIDVTSTIENVGELENGQMGVPKEINNVGWFEPGILPGSQGSAVMAGHIDSLTGPAIFYKLDQLKTNDEVIVKGADGESLTFVVTKTETYPRKEAPIEQIFGFSYGSRLNLITCTGDFNKKAKTHEERLVVYTELAKTDAAD